MLRRIVAAGLLSAAAFAVQARQSIGVGTGLIIGRVIEADSGKGIAGAVVRLSTDAGSAEPVVTDAQGQFVFRALPKGSYMLRASHSAYLDGAYGQRAAGDHATRPLGLIDLGQDQRLADVAITLWKPASLSGTVVDDAGDPMIDATVRVLHKEVVAGQWRYVLQPVSDRTDDRGAFRVTGLAPGDYAVALPALAVTSRKQRAADAGTPMALMESAVGAFKWLDATVAGRTIDLGDDQIALVAYGQVPSVASVNGGHVLAGQTQYYPDALTIKAATTIALRTGDDHAGVDFHVRPISTVRVSGTIAGPAGATGDLLLRLVSADASALTQDPEVAQTTSDANGRFTFLGVPAGEYAIRVLRAAPLSTSAAKTSSTTVQVAGERPVTVTDSTRSTLMIPETPTWWADTPVSVGDEDLDAVAVKLQTGARIKGRVVFDGPAKSTPTVTFSTIAIERADGGELLNPQLSIGRLDETGAFTTYGLPAGRYFVRVADPAVPGWYFKGAMIGARDVSVSALELGADDVTDVALTFVAKPLAEISGIVKDERGQPETSATVVVFPVDREAWMNTGATPRTIRADKVDAAGRYRVTALPASDYFIAALTDATAEWSEASALDALSRGALRVRVGATDRKTADLRVTKHRPLVIVDAPSVDPAREHGPFVDDQAQATPPPPARQTPARPPVATPSPSPTPTAPAGPPSAVISGVVVTAGEKPQPIRRAQVTLRGPALPQPRVVTTDDGGRFDFGQLPSGRFELSATKLAFLTTDYGATKPGRPGTPIAIASGQKIAGLNVALIHGAALTGTIRDERGQPVEGAITQALQFRMVNGERRFTAVPGFRAERSDDRGVYRVFGLAPGDYAIVGTVPIGGSGSLRITTAADLQAATDALNRVPGRSGVPSPPVGQTGTIGYAPVFYPGTTEVANAKFVTVAPGEEKPALDFVIAPVPTAKVDGRVTAGIGMLPPTVSVRLIAVGRPDGILPAGLAGDVLAPVRPRNDGTFSFTGVTPGRYVVSASTAAPQGGRPGGAGSAINMFATADITVAGSDISNVSLTLVSGVTVSGSVSFIATTSRLPSLSGTTVTLTPIASPVGIAASPVSTLTTGAGSFSIAGVTPGRYALQATLGASSTGWVQRGVTVGNGDVVDDVIELRPGGNASVAVTFIDKPAEVTGVLTNPAGRVAPDFYVMLFPADQSLWRAGSRRIVITRPGVDGKFALRALPAGNYLLAALTDVAPDEWNDPAFLSQLATNAVKITLAEGERRVQNIAIK